MLLLFTLNLNTRVDKFLVQALVFQLLSYLAFLEASYFVFLEIRDNPYLVLSKIVASFFASGLTQTNTFSLQDCSTS